jgi:hypothetical protein
MLWHKPVQYVASSKCFFKDCNWKERVNYKVIYVPSRWDPPLGFDACVIEVGPSKLLNNTITRPNTRPTGMRMSNDQKTLLPKPSLLNPTLLRMSFNDRLFSQTAKKPTKATIQTP